jgi:hypothetical protein
MGRKVGCVFLALACFAAWSGMVQAADGADRATARNLANAAKRDFDAGRLEDAESKLERAFAIAKVPTLAVWSARVKVKRGRLVAGSEFYRQVARLTRNDFWIGNAQEKAQADAKTELEALEPRIPKLRIQVQGAAPDEVELRIDDAKAEGAWAGIDLPADPGHHRIVGKRNAQIVELAVDLVEGESKDTLLAFNSTADSAAKALAFSNTPHVDQAANLTSSSLPPEPASTRPIYSKWWFWTGVGAVAIAGTVTAIVLTRHPGNTCSGASVTCKELP